MWFCHVCFRCDSSQRNTLETFEFSHCLNHVCPLYEDTCQHATGYTFIVECVRTSQLMSLTFNGYLIAIRVHRRHDVNAGTVDQLCDLRVSTIVTAQVLDEVKHQLSAHHFITMHVGYILKLWLTWRKKNEWVKIYQNRTFKAESSWHVRKRKYPNSFNQPYKTYHAHGQWGCLRWPSHRARGLPRSGQSCRGWL